MSAGILDSESSLDHHLEHLVFTLALVLAHPLANQHGPAFEQMLDRWWQVDRQEKTLWIEILKAAAIIVAADNRLDALVDKLLNALQGEEHEKLREFILKGKRPSEIKRPVLRGQLAQMKAWVRTLEESGKPAIVAIGAEIKAATDQGDAAEKALEDAKRRAGEFRQLGDRRAFVDALNALRKATHGALAELPHAQPVLGLPNGFAESFFKPVRAPRRNEGEPKTAAEAADRVAALEEELAAARALMSDLQATEAARIEAETRRAA
ncbi:MAG TPA: hypothetical protein VLS89_04430, partial [Candidatus Nanopelagicales bacterium]|nr:hypothetical protein [Candidatus Nanopelagicales bacterium]